MKLHFLLLAFPLTLAAVPFQQDPFDYHFVDFPGPEYEPSPLEHLFNFDLIAQDFILETKKIEIPGHPYAFNPSIIRWGESLLMSFRTYNPTTGSTNPFGLVWVDRNFNPISEPQVFELPFKNPVLFSKQQDPRLMVVSDRLFVIYNNILENVTNREMRRMFIAEMVWEDDHFTASEPEVLEDFEGKNDNRYEKNWVPFEYDGELLLSYSIIPHRVLRPNPGTHSCETLCSTKRPFQWDWGVPRGGSQAFLDGDHYLAFFHSWIDIPTVQSAGKKVTHYVMGAYTFDAHPPFPLIAASPEPIVAHNFYRPPFYKTWKPLRCVFPAGLVIDHDTIWLAYGRQDHEIWISKIDKKKIAAEPGPDFFQGIVKTMVRYFLTAILMLHPTAFSFASQEIDLEAEAQEFVLETRKIEIPGHPDAFNPSIVRWQGKLLMSFRILPDPKNRFTSEMGIVLLNEDFEPLNEPQILHLREETAPAPSRAEDLCFLTLGDRLFIVYDDNEEVKISKGGFRMYVAELLYDGEHFLVNETEALRHYYGESRDIREKSWVPFAYQDHLLLAYSLVPHRIFMPRLDGTGICDTACCSNSRIRWDYGILRGGTAATLEGNQYLSFFHSSINMATLHSKGANILHYFMGAYTFSKDPPFAITAISPGPIIGKNFYNGILYKPYWKPTRCIFPRGHISDDKSIWVSYGREDHECWIMKIDKKKLLQSLVPLQEEPPSM